MNLLFMANNGLPRNGLVALYDMGKQIQLGNTGQTLVDFSGRGNSAQLGSTAGANTNDPAWSSGGLSFSGDDFVDTGKVKLGNTGLFCDANEAFTVFVAFKVTLATTGTILSNSPSSYLDAVFHFNIGDNNGIFNYYRGGINSIGNNTGNPMLYTMRWDKSKAQHALMLNDLGDGFVGAKPFLADQRIMMGARTNGTGFYLQNGTIYFVAIYDRALTDAELYRARNNIVRTLQSRGVTI